MEAFLFYLFKSSICLAVLYLPYRMLLRKETFFHINRFVLLTICLLSFILPLVNLSWLLQENYIFFPEITVESYKKNQLTSNNPSNWVLPCIAICYFVGATSVLFRKIIEWIKLRRMIHQGQLWIHDEEGIRIHCHINPIVPFSWMNHIVISEKDYLENGKQILLHETAHIRCHHSWDIIWISFMEVLQWFNPFVWLLSIDLQDLHEFEADAFVIRHGEDTRNYQLLLIEKAVAKSPYPMANSFKSSPIKLRIHMMNKRPSSSWAKMKHIYLIPIAFFLMVTFSSKASSIPQESTELTDEMKETLIYIARHLKYPTDAFEKGVQGKVVLELHLTEHEHLNTVKVIESVAPSLDAEAIRIIKETPIWKKSYKNTTKLLMPVIFRLM